MVAGPHVMVKLGRYGKVVTPNRALDGKGIKSWSKRPPKSKLLVCILFISAMDET